MKGLIITNAYAKSEEYYNQPERLREELLKNGVFTDILPLDTSMCGISACGESIFNLKDYNFCVFYDKDPYAIQLIEKSGLRCFNTYEAMSACDDKMLTAIKLANFGIPMPETYFSPLCYVSSASVSAEDISFLSDRLGYPMIVKECYGSLGKGVHLIRNENELKEIAEKLKFTPHLYQKYISESFGTDIRAIVVGGKFDIPGFDIRQNPVQPRLDRVVVLFCQNPAICQHLRVRLRACDILLVKPLVKGDRCVKIVDKLVGRFLEASCPKFHNLTS